MNAEQKRPHRAPDPSLDLDRDVQIPTSSDCRDYPIANEMGQQLTGTRTHHCFSEL
jgi:hypothetical protein